MVTTADVFSVIEKNEGNIIKILLNIIKIWIKVFLTSYYLKKVFYVFGFLKINGHLTVISEVLRFSALF